MAARPARRRAVPLAVTAVLLLFAAALVFRWWSERRIVGPWYLDEFLYGRSAREIASDWSRLVREFAAHYYLYPRLIAPGWLAGSMPTTYALAKGINVLLITSAAVPLYLWARRVLSLWRSALAVALVLALPTGLYSGLLVTENAFFPAFVLAAFLLALALENPTPLRQVLAIAAVALTYAVRVQGVVFLAIIPSAVVLKAIFDARQAHERLSWRRFRPYLLLLGLLAAGLALYVLHQVLVGEKLSSWIGAYGAAVNVHNYSAAHALKWIAYHFGGIALAVGLVPVVALVLLAAESWRRGTRMTAAERALVAVGVSAVFWLVLETGIIASGSWADRMSERYMFHAEPLLLLALVVWVNRGAPRPRGALVIGLAASVALVMTLPLEWLLGQPAIFSDAFSLVALNRFSQHIGGAHTLWFVVSAVAIVAAGLVAVAPRRVIAFAPYLALAYLIAASIAVPGALRDSAAAVRAGAQIGVPVDWIDRAVGRSSRVDLIYTGDLEPERERMTVLQTEFWNRSVRILDVLAPLPNLCCVARRLASTDRSTGVVRPDGGPVLPADFVVMLPPVGKVEGTKVASAAPLTLVRPASPIRLLSETRGVYSDGWMGSHSSYTVYGGPMRRVRVRLSRSAWCGTDVPGRAAISVGGMVRARAVVHACRTVSVAVAAPKPPFEVTVSIEPTFVPAELDPSSFDTRQLGAEVTYSSTAIRSSTRRKTKAPSASATIAAPQR